MKIRNERVVVNGLFHEQGSVLRGDAEGFCDSFEVEISLDSEEPLEEIKTLIRLSRRMCFTEKALTGTIEVKVVQEVNGNQLDL